MQTIKSHWRAARDEECASHSDSVSAQSLTITIITEANYTIIQPPKLDLEAQIQCIARAQRANGLPLGSQRTSVEPVHVDVEKTGAATAAFSTSGLRRAAAQRANRPTSLAMAPGTPRRWSQPGRLPLASLAVAMTHSTYLLCVSSPSRPASRAVMLCTRSMLQYCLPLPPLVSELLGEHGGLGGKGGGDAEKPNGR